MAGATLCLAHASAQDQAAALERFSKTGTLDVRGVTIAAPLLERILDATPLGWAGDRVFSDAVFAGATFEGAAEFSGATFKVGAGLFSGTTFKNGALFVGATFNSVGVVAGATFDGNAEFRQAAFNGGAGLFSGATFDGNAEFRQAAFNGGAGLFSGATFNSVAVFAGATFDGNAEFRQAAFKDGAWFVGATFKNDAGFDEVTFGGNAVFPEATFNGDAKFRQAAFKDGAWFAGATFKSGAVFSEATFKNSTRFSYVTFKRGAQFDRATFDTATDFSKATFQGRTEFSGATFDGNAEFGQATFKGAASFARARFKDSAVFPDATFMGDIPELRLMVEGTLDLDQVQSASPIRIQATAAMLACRGARFPGGVRLGVRRAFIRLDDSDLSAPSLLTGSALFSSDPAEEQPKLLSLQGANVAGLTLGNIDLAACRFAGSHNLDKLRLEADAAFGLSPAVAGWERRQVIAEEATWRAARRWPWRWMAPPWPSPGDQPEKLSPGAIAGLYRALRKGREDAKDEPGAADFYYGEMEMRRHDRGTVGANRWRGRATRIVLWAYWLVSGYGLRASRSIAALAIMTTLFAMAFYFIGFIKPPEPASYWTSLLYAFRSTISLTDSQVTLTAWGSFFQALLRITGPVLLGLTLLALRGRVKR